MGKNGGSRPGAGRPSKIQEIKLVESMDRIAVPDEIWKALLYKIKEGDVQAMKLWLSYRLGLPKQQIDVTTNGESIAPPIQWLTKQIDYNQVETLDYLDSVTLDYLDSDSLDTLDNESVTRLDE
jgi:hypothetical protein